MAKTSKKKEEEISFTFPSSPQDRKSIKDAIYEMAGALQFIDDKREYIKDVSEMLHEKYALPKKISAKLARTVHKDNFSEISEEGSTLEAVYEGLFETADTTPIPAYDPNLTQTEIDSIDDGNDSV